MTGVAPTVQRRRRGRPSRRDYIDPVPEDKRKPFPMKPLFADEIDKRIAEYFEKYPAARLREASMEIGIPPVLIMNRLNGYRGNQWIDRMRLELQLMFPKILDAIEQGLDSCDPYQRAMLAMKLLEGLGVMKAERLEVSSTQVNIINDVSSTSVEDLKQRAEWAKRRLGMTEEVSQVA